MRRFILFVLSTMFWMATGFAQNWYQVGFKVSSKMPLTRQYSSCDYLSSVRSVQFGGYFRAGRYVFGEVGIGYEYFRGNFTHTEPNGIILEDWVENRYLVIPIKVVGDVTFAKHFSFLPYAGILYNPLLKVTENHIGYSKNNIENHWTQFTAGFDFRLKFIILGVDYRLSCQNFFRDRDGQLPQFIGFNAGVQF